MMSPSKLIERIRAAYQRARDSFLMAERVFDDANDVVLRVDNFVSDLQRDLRKEPACGVQLTAYVTGPGLPRRGRRYTTTGAVLRGKPGERAFFMFHVQEPTDKVHVQAWGDAAITAAILDGCSYTYAGYSRSVVVGYDEPMRPGSIIEIRYEAI